MGKENKQNQWGWHEMSMLWSRIKRRKGKLGTCCGLDMGIYEGNRPGILTK